jgi:hypothetical protein
MATAAPAQPAAPRRGIKALLARHPLISYLIITFAFSWLVWVPGVLGPRVISLLLLFTGVRGRRILGSPPSALRSSPKLRIAPVLRGRYQTGTLGW